jgi:hypothetical protein
MRRLLAALALVAAVVAVPAPAAPITFTVGLTPAQQCALARPRVHVPIPDHWNLTCHRSDWPGGSWGATTYTGWDKQEVARIDLHVSPNATVEVLAELMAHEVAHGYIAGAHRGGADHDDWVADHEPYVEHFARCLVRTGPC